MLTRTDPLGNVTTYTYDGNSNVLSVARQVATGVNETAIYTYDAGGRKLTETEPSGRVTTYSYDTAGRLVSTAVSGGGMTSYTYNGRGLAASITEPDGVTVSRTYDDLDRLVQETWSSDNTSNTYTYGCCHLEIKTARNGTVTHYDGHDENGHLLATTDALANTTEFEYDANGNRTVVRDALNHETVMAYDLLNRPVLVTHPDGTTESTVYDALGRQVRQTDRAGRAQTTVYDTAGNVTSTQLEVTIGQGTQTVTLSTSTHDAAGRVLTSTNADGLTVPYTYDALGRQVQTTWPDQTSAATTYGMAGVLTQTDRMGSTTTYAYDTLGRLASVTAPAAALGAPQAVTAYAYDSIGRRASVTDPLGRATSFTYDQEGRTTTVTHTRTYVCGLDLSGQLGGEGMDPMATAGGIGGILVVSSSSSAGGTLPATNALFLYDGNGNVMDLLDAGTAAVLATYEYGPFGNTLVASGPLADTNPIRFSTKYAEAARLPGSAAGPDLYYYGARYYSPGIGRWTSRDPIGEQAGANPFAAMANAPTEKVDGLGLFECRSEGFAAHDPWYLMLPIPPGASGSGVSGGCHAWFSHWGSAVRPFSNAICNSGVPDTHITISARSPCCKRYRVTCTVVYNGEAGQETPAASPPNRGTQVHLIANNLGQLGDWLTVAAPGADSIWRAKLVKTMSVTRVVQIGPSWATLVRVMPVITAGTREGNDSGRWRGAYLNEYSSARCSLSEIGPCN